MANRQAAFGTRRSEIVDGILTMRSMPDLPAVNPYAMDRGLPNW